MKNEKQKYFYGNPISEYGMQNGYVDYRCLSQSFELILNNNIIDKTINIGYWEQLSGQIDNQDEIQEIKMKVDDLKIELEETDDKKECDRIQEQIDKWNEEIEELELEEEPDDIYQFYIISPDGCEVLKQINENVFYNEELDLYVWGVTHYGTSWDYVLTDFKIDY